MEIWVVYSECANFSLFVIDFNVNASIRDLALPVYYCTGQQTRQSMSVELTILELRDKWQWVANSSWRCARPFATPKEWTEPVKGLEFPEKCFFYILEGRWIKLGIYDGFGRKMSFRPHWKIAEIILTRPFADAQACQVVVAAAVVCCSLVGWGSQAGTNIASWKSTKTHHGH